MSHFSLKDLVLYSGEGTEYLWAKRCLADAIVPIWFREDLRPNTTKFHMIRFRDEDHARSCCRGEASFQSQLIDLTAYEQLYPEEAQTGGERSRTFSVLLVSGPSFAAFLRFPRFSMDFWGSMEERISAKSKFDEKRLNRTWCNACLKRDDNMRRCKNCKAAPYCSSACIRSDWRRHKPFCRNIVANIK